VSAHPKCSTGLGGIGSAGLPNGHVKDHFPGKLFGSLVLH
jgi:E1A/CREB-binding protein